MGSPVLSHSTAVVAVVFSRLLKVDIVEYTAAQKLAGLDLHGLPCRIPEPVGKQKECSHTRFEWTDCGEGYFDDNGEWVVLESRVEVTTMRDIPGTNNMKCDICGYARRY